MSLPRGKIAYPIPSPSTLEQWQTGAEQLGHSGFLKLQHGAVAMPKVYLVCSVSLRGRGGVVTQRLSSGNRENYTKSTCSALPYPISIKCRRIAIQRAGTCFTSISRVVLQSIPRGSRELSPFYKWGNSDTGIKAKMFQPGCLLLGTYTHIYATRGLIFQKGRAMKILAWGICSHTVYW